MDISRKLPPVSHSAILRIIVLLAVLALLSPNAARKGFSGEETCIGCHSGTKARELGLKDVYMEIDSFRYRHPIGVKGCRQCHISEEFTLRDWVLMGPATRDEQIFFLTNLSPEWMYEIDVEVQGGRGKKSTLPTITFVPSNVDKAIENDQSPPNIKNVEVVELKEGIFMYATVRWETDVPANSIVKYGLTKDYGEIVSYDKVFTTDHHIRMTGLKAGSTYNFRIISRDLFGDATVSDNYILNTSRPFKKEKAVNIDGDTPVIKEASLFRIGKRGEVCLKVVNAGPARTFVKIREFSVANIGSGHGNGLKPVRDLTIYTCVKCHPQGISHPVGISSMGRDTAIPSKLPTIEDGVITCVTCHKPHGGEVEYFSRLPRKRELCIACHTDPLFI